MIVVYIISKKVFFAVFTPQVYLLSHSIISNKAILGDPYLHYGVWGGDRHICLQIFCTKFNSEQLLFEAFFDLICIFGGVER